MDPKLGIVISDNADVTPKLLRRYSTVKVASYK
jgi:hypothetical protein